MIKIKHYGDFKHTEKFLRKLRDKTYLPILEKYAKEGVEALKQATPKDTSKTEESWSYEIVIKKDTASIHWTNSNIVDGIPVVILLQYGHGTRSGSFVDGKDFINPAMKPIFDKISENLWKEVKDL